MLMIFTEFANWLNVIDESVRDDAQRRGIDNFEAAGLRDDAPQSAIDAFRKYVIIVQNAREKMQMV
jgi:hypothetical protein